MKTNIKRDPGKHNFFLRETRAKRKKKFNVRAKSKAVTANTSHWAGAKKNRKLYFCENNIRFQTEKSDRVSIDFLSSFCYCCCLCPGSPRRVCLQGAWWIKKKHLKLKSSFFSGTKGFFCLWSENRCRFGRWTNAVLSFVSIRVNLRQTYCELPVLNSQRLIKKPWICFPWIIEKVLVSVYGFNFRCFIGVETVWVTKFDEKRVVNFSDWNLFTGNMGSLLQWKRVLVKNRR